MRPRKNAKNENEGEETTSVEEKPLNEEKPVDETTES